MNTIIAQLIALWKDKGTMVDIENHLNIWFQGWNEWLMQHAIERMDKELYYHYKQEGWKIDRKEPRTVQFQFGQVTFYRRRLEKEGEQSFLALDKALGLEKYKRHSPHVKAAMAQLGAQMPYRQAEKALKLAGSVRASHTTIHKATQEVGGKVEHYLNQYDYASSNKKRKKVKAIFIEGDGVMINGREKKSPTIHRIVIHEGVNREKKRHTLINPMIFSSLESSQDAFKQAAHYLNQVYNLKETIVVTNSDGGSGYEADKFESIIGYSKQHEHFRDLFHVHKKIKERLFFDKPLAKQMEKAIYRYDWDRIETLCATIESRLIDLPEVIVEERMEQIRKLKNYLARNWIYIKPFKKRDLPIESSTGVGETGHRLYTYRMKRQGRSWTKKGASHVVSILTAEKNGLLQTALTAEITDKVESLGEDIKGAVRQALKKATSPSHTVQTGSIVNYGPKSSFIGQLGLLFS